MRLSGCNTTFQDPSLVNNLLRHGEFWVPALHTIHNLSEYSLGTSLKLNKLIINAYNVSVKLSQLFKLFVYVRKYIKISLYSVNLIGMMSHFMRHLRYDLTQVRCYAVSLKKIKKLQL